MRMDLRRIDKKKSAVSDHNPVSEGDSWKIPINATNLEELPCRCSVLITSQDHNLKEHRTSCVE